MHLTLFGYLLVKLLSFAELEVEFGKRYEEITHLRSAVVFTITHIVLKNNREGKKNKYVDGDW